MRTFRRLSLLVGLSSVLGLSSALAFESTRAPNGIAPAASVDVFRRSNPEASLGSKDLQSPPAALRNLTPVEAFRTGAQALRAGDTKSGIVSLEYAAASGHPIAQWKLGRMYAEGDGVKQDDLRAFEYFREIADAHADESPVQQTPISRALAHSGVRNQNKSRSPVVIVLFSAVESGGKGRTMPSRLHADHKKCWGKPRRSA